MKKQQQMQKEKKEEDNLDKLLQDEENFYRVSKKQKKSSQEDPEIKSTQITQAQKSVWHDDEQVEVDLTQTARLRKLRQNEEETTISGIQYQQRLQDFYEKKLYKTDFFKWGQADQNQEFTESDNLLDLPSILNTDYRYFESSLNQGTQNQLEIVPGVLNIHKLGKVLQKDKHNAVVQNVNFYQNTGVFLTCGQDKLLKIFSINENEKFSKNRIIKIKQVYTEDMPLTHAQFLNSQNQIIACGARKNLICYDLVKDSIQKISSNFFTQRFKKSIDNFAVSLKEEYIALWDTNGFIYILSGQTKQYQFELKISNGQVLSAVFSPDSNYLYASSSTGKIFQFDMNTKKIFDAFQDPGSLNSAYLASSPNYLLSASSSSYLNVFSEGKVLKSLDNLTTPLSGCVFSPSFQLAAFFSEKKQNSIRIVNFPDLQVVKNWPNLQSKMGHITSCGWGMNGSIIALGNKAGDIEVYKIGK